MGRLDDTDLEHAQQTDSGPPNRATAKRKWRKRFVLALRSAALLLAGMGLGVLVMVALDSGLSWGVGSPHTSESRVGSDPRPQDPPPSTELARGARAGAYAEARAAAGLAAGSVTFMDADGRRWRCFEAMNP